MADPTPTIADRMAEYGVTMSTPNEMRRTSNGSVWWCFLHKEGYDDAGWRREVFSPTEPTIVEVVDEIIEADKILSEGGADGDFTGYLRQFSLPGTTWTFDEIAVFYQDHTQAMEAVKEAAKFFGNRPWFDLTENTQRPEQD
jgi:hypothetical protein